MGLPNISSPKTLPHLLHQRAGDPNGTYFLNLNGGISSSLSYSSLFEDAQKLGTALVAAGVVGGGRDIVVANFEDQRKHITLFWACCFAGVPFCPVPPFHPDPSRQNLLLQHLEQLFHHPTFIADAPVLNQIKALLPTAKLLDYEELITSATSMTISSAVYPERIPQATETVALMLTSGSTGHSKAVVLPHTMILSAVRGKAEMHQTTEQSVFFNWINFDHVANVTECHIHALYAGASQYQVSPSAIIQRPRNFLDWCSKYHVSHTFAPNFLLALICRDPSFRGTNSPPPSNGASHLNLSALRVVISGGEANPVGTAVDFADLIESFGSPRNTLRPGFGMTETGAGSIYNLQPIASSPDHYARKYLALGKTHSFMQMRIFDPHMGTACSVGAAGFLQVRGPCVFSEYYMNPEATQSAFSDGWFTTGDFGLIDEEGQLQMLGRDKEDINVNGVKHPCVDVEHYVEDSNIPGVEVSYVFVAAHRLEGADTETYVVFYRHSSVFTEPIDEGKGLSESALSEILATHHGIKNICSLFCSRAPHAILPLPRQYFVKTALGKISRSALAKAYTSGKFSAIETYIADAVQAQASLSNEKPRSALDEILCEGVAQVFGHRPHTIELNQNLFDLGASSMHLIRLKQFLQNRLRIRDIPTIELLKRPVLYELSSYLHSLLAEDNKSSKGYNPLVCFTAQGSKPPLYLVHPGVGEVLVFINLARILEDDRPVYALRAPGFEEGESPPSDMQELVDSYTEAVEKTYPSGPYFIAGYSFGAAVAVEMGKKLEKKGKRVAWIGILNLPPEIQFRMRELVWLETALNLSAFLGLIQIAEFEDFKQRLLTVYPESSQDSEPSCSLQIIEWIYSHCNQERLEELELPLSSFSRWINVSYGITCTGRSYVTTEAVWGALTTVFCAIPLPSLGTREQYKQDRLSKWKAFSGEHFEMIDVAGEHYTMLSDPHVYSFAPLMRDALLRAEALLDEPALTGPNLLRSDM